MFKGTRPKNLCCHSTQELLLSVDYKHCRVSNSPGGISARTTPMAGMGFLRGTVPMKFLPPGISRNSCSGDTLNNFPCSPDCRLQSAPSSLLQLHPPFSYSFTQSLDLAMPTVPVTTSHTSCFCRAPRDKFHCK